ncbi:MAG: hypothetical protein ACRC5C_01760 [Bacilli bacterium]
MNYVSMDLGNGDNKYLINDNGARIEKSVIAPYESFTGMWDVAALNYKGFNFICGDDAVNTSNTLIYALGKQDFSRIEDESYMRLSIGTLAKHFMRSTDIASYAVGLPLSQYKANKDALIDMFTRPHEIAVNGKDVVIDIKRTMVIPQPVGTYYFLLVTQSVKQTDHTVIIDGGHLTNDIVLLKGNDVAASVNDDNGAKYLMLDIKEYIAETYKTNVPVERISEVLRNGLFYDGETIRVGLDDAVTDIKRKHFEKLMNTVRNGGLRLEDAHNIVLTGGASALYANVAKEYNKRILSLGNGRTATAEGFHFKNRIECMNNA